MAVYSSPAEVLKWMPGGTVFDETTVPSLSDVTTKIASASALVDMAFGASGATLPIVDATVLAAIAVRVAREVAYQFMAVRGAWPPGTNAPEWVKWHAEFEQLLKDIVSGGVIDVPTVAGSSANVSSFPDSTVESRLRKDKLY